MIEHGIKRVKSGIPGFDDLIQGGFPENTTVLVAGGTGTGKTTFGLQFIYKGAEKYEEPGVFVSLEERAKDLRREVKTFGWDIQALENQKLMATVGLPSEEKFALEESFNIDSFLRYIYRVVKAIDAKRLVIDSVPSLAFRLEDERKIREVLLKLNTILLEMGVTTILTTEAPDPKGGRISRYGIEEYISRGLVLLDLQERNIELKRYLLIRKMRETKHSMRKYPFEITTQGIVVYPSGEIY